MSEEPKHKRLSAALCEAVEFGLPTKIRMGPDDYTALLASIDSAFGPFDYSNAMFENVPVEVERDRTGCVVEHDSRYLNCTPIGPPRAISETVAFDRRTRKPGIVAW